jgi:hypothetical protein
MRIGPNFKPGISEQKNSVRARARTESKGPLYCLLKLRWTMKHRIGLSQLAATIHAYPTFAELGRKVGDRYSKKRLTPFLKNAFTWLYRRSKGPQGSPFRVSRQRNFPA